MGLDPGFDSGLPNRVCCRFALPFTQLSFLARIDRVYLACVFEGPRALGRMPLGRRAYDISYYTRSWPTPGFICKDS